MSQVLADPSLYEFTGGEPPSPEELARRYEAQTRGRSSDGSQEWINLIVTLGPDQPIGYVQATVPTDGGPTEIAWVIGAAWQGRGHARAAVRLLVDDLAGRGIEHLVAHIHPDHIASQRIAAAMGLEPTDVIEDGEVRWERPAGH